MNLRQLIMQVHLFTTVCSDWKQSNPEKGQWTERPLNTHFLQFFFKTVPVFKKKKKSFVVCFRFLLFFFCTRVLSSLDKLICALTTDRYNCWQISITLFRCFFISSWSSSSFILFYFFVRGGVGGGGKGVGGGGGGGAYFAISNSTETCLNLKVLRRGWG